VDGRGSIRRVSRVRSGLPTAEDTTTPPTDLPTTSAAADVRSIPDGDGRPARLGRPTKEDPRIDLDTLIGPYAGAIIAGLVVVVLALCAAVVGLVRRTGRLDARLAGLTRGGEGQSLEGVLDAHLDKVDAVARTVDGLVGRTAVLEAAQRKAFQRVGLVRYNPFEETGGNQSFALALLDARGDGWVLSSLHARSGTRVYAKAIAGGRADAALSEEESAAINQAMA
jgi:hypothetical protein